MTNSEAVRFAQEWIENFNRKDVQSVLRHFAEEATFTSPRAVAFGGRATLQSKEELTAYWNSALGSIRSLRFTLDRAVNDPVAKHLVILYTAEIDGKRLRAAEVYEFDESSRVIRGEALYGALLE